MEHDTVSIHAPVKVRHELAVEGDSDGVVSIHAPVKVRHQHISPFCSLGVFQFTHP